MTDGEAREMARDLVRGSIIEDASAQFIAQILKHVHDERVKPLRDRIEALVKDRDAGAKDYCALMDRHDELHKALAAERETVARLVEEHIDYVYQREGGKDG